MIAHPIQAILDYIKPIHMHHYQAQFAPKLYRPHFTCTLATMKRQGGDVNMLENNRNDNVHRVAHFACSSCSQHHTGSHDWKRHWQYVHSPAGVVLYYNEIWLCEEC